ncbi:hypothetical protein AK830_g5314 [Neonectria ditissima]|uniref:Uncharacterized protein n=1 Tax=Neonectria ditissima TaxID=78410 RepID=A0A0P7B5J1_9HYPO|nr:hypothetical protein AK830_g5314 [Neonectria ditissima]
MPRIASKSSVSDQTPKRSRAATGSESSPGPPRKHPTKSSLQDRQTRQKIPQDPVDELDHSCLMDTNPPMSPQRGAAEGENLEPVIADSQLPESQLPGPQLSSLRHTEDAQLEVSEADNPTPTIADDAHLLDAHLIDAHLLDAQSDDAQSDDAQTDDAQLEDVQPEEGEGNDLKTAIADSQLPGIQQRDKNPSGLPRLSWDSKPGDFAIPFPFHEQNERWRESLFFDEHAGASIDHTTWGPFICDVVRFVDHCLPRRASWNSLGIEIQGKIQRWAGNKGERYIEDERASGVGAETLCDAWVWRLLYDNLFSPNCTDKWFGEHWVAYGKLRLALRGHITHADNSLSRSYHSWRYTSARMLYAVYGGHSDPKRLKGILRQELGQLIQIRGADPESVEEYLDKLVAAAISIDLQVEVSKDNIWFEMHDPETQKLSGFIYKDSATVESGSAFRNFDELNGRPVDFIRSPAIWIYGRGKTRAYCSSACLFGSESFHVDYDRGRLMAKMKVVVDQFPDQKDEQDVGVEEGGKEGGAEA